MNEYPTFTPRRATWAFMGLHPLRLIALGFGSGLSPVAPGTAGTLAGWALYLVIDRFVAPTHLGWAGILIAGFFVGWWACMHTAREMAVSDPSAVVWDEIIAFWLVLLLVTPATLTGQFWAFVVFRFFDMVKPQPIRYFDRHLKGGFGIMFDDIAAAFFTLLVIALWRMTV